jgi:hypothetical protein
MVTHRVYLLLDDLGLLFRRPTGIQYAEAMLSFSAVLPGVGFSIETVPTCTGCPILIVFCGLLRFH